MAGTPILWVKPVGVFALAAVVPGLLLGLWVHGHTRADSLRTNAAVNSGGKVLPALWLASLEPLYSLAERPRLQKVCIPARNQPRYQQKLIYEFDEEHLEPDPVGPRVRERPRHGSPRELRQSQAMLQRRGEALRQCYRWARFRQRSLQGVVRVEVRIDPFGTWAPLRAVPEMTGGAELAACVGAALTGLHENWVIPRNTEAQFRIRFVPSSQRPPLRAPPRPASSPSDTETGPACLWLPALVPTDRLAPLEPLLQIDDYDVQQAREDEEFDFARKLAALQRDFRQKLAAAKRTGKLVALPPRPMRSPVVEVSSCTGLVRGWPVGSSEIRQSLRYNRGAYGTCYAQALVRRPGLAGRVVLGATVDHAGSLTVRVQQSTVHDADLEECLRQAVEEVWIEPWYLDSGLAEFTYPLVLSPAPASEPASEPQHDTIAGIEARAKAQLDQSDGNAALRSYSALLRQIPDHPHLCQWHAGALAATLALAPWQDERVLAAANDLVRILATHSGSSAEPQRSVCLSLAAPLLTRLATNVHRIGGRYQLMTLLDLAVQRYQLALRVGPDLPDADHVRHYLAEALWSGKRYCEAAPVYLQVALSAPKEQKPTDAALAAFLSWQRCLRGDTTARLSARF